MSCRRKRMQWRSDWRMLPKWIKWLRKRQVEPSKSNKSCRFSSREGCRCTVFARMETAFTIPLPLRSLMMGRRWEFCRLMIWRGIISIISDFNLQSQTASSRLHSTKQGRFPAFLGRRELWHSEISTQSDSLDLKIPLAMKKPDRSHIERHQNI